MKKKNSTICRQIYRKQQLDCCSRVIWNYIRLHVQSATPRKVSTRIIFLRNLIWRFRIGVSVTCYLHCLTNNSACKELIKVNKEDVKEWIRTSAWSFFLNLNKLLPTGKYCYLQSFRGISRTVCLGFVYFVKSNGGSWISRDLWVSYVNIIFRSSN